MVGFMATDFHWSMDFFGWVSWVELVARCVSGGFETEFSGFCKGYGLGSGGGYGEWSSVISVVGILSVDSGSLTSGGDLDGSLENRLSITWLISSSFRSLPRPIGVSPIAMILATSCSFWACI